jgi:DNA-binding NarL/FixJ family response regulator
MRTLREIERLNPAVVVLHLTSGEREEIELIRRLARGSRSRQVIVVAAAHSLETEQMVRAAGATVYFEDATPEVLDAAVAACTRAVQRNALLAEDADRAAAHRNGSTDACRQDGAWRPEKDGSEQ